MTEEEKKRKLDWDNALRGQPTSFGRPVENNAFKYSLSGEPVENGANGQDGANGQGMRSYDDIYKYLDEQIKATAPETEEQRKRRVRAERTHALMNGIADVGRAFANLMATNNYAPNGYEQSQSLSDKARERWDKASAERAKRRAENWNYRMMKQRYADAERDYKDKRSDADRANKIALGKLDNERRKLDYYDRQEDRRQAEYELRERAQDWKEKFEQGKLDIAQMNADIKKMAEHYRQSRANINHNLSSWKRIKRYTYDSFGKKTGEIEERIVVNPQTGELETQENVITYNNKSAGNNASLQGGGKSGGNNGSKLTNTAKLGL